MILFECASERYNHWGLYESKYGHDLEDNYLLLRMKRILLIKHDQKNNFIISKVHIYHFYMNQDITVSDKDSH